MRVSGTFHFKFQDGEVHEFSSDYLRTFRARAFVARPELAERISLPMIVSMLALEVRYELGSAIAQAVIDLETCNNSAGTKPASPFNRPPLIGLWHAHFTDARFLAENYRLALPEKQRYQLFVEALKQTEGLPLDDRAEEIVNRVWEEPLDNRFAQGKATGEWIVYLPRKGKNYYLATAKHQRGVEAQGKLLAEIIETCAGEFPELANWIQEAADSHSAL